LIKIICSILLSIFPILIAWIGKNIIDSIINIISGKIGIGNQIVFWISLECLLMIVSIIIDRLNFVVQETAGNKISLEISVTILRKADKLDLKSIENPLYYDLLSKAKKEASPYALLVFENNLTVIRSALTLFGYIIVIVSYNFILLPILIVAAIPAFISEVYFSHRAFNLRNKNSTEKRKLAYYEHMLTTDKYAKEIKLFNIGDVLVKKYIQIANDLKSRDNALVWRHNFWCALLGLLSNIMFYGCYAHFAFRTVEGIFSIGTMSFYIAAFRQCQLIMGRFLSSIGLIYEGNLYMAHFFNFLNIQEQGKEGNKENDYIYSGGGDIKNEYKTGIYFQNVGFHYPNSTKWILHNVTLHIKAGEKIAIVGTNGAGKTTILKLITGLYYPTQGRIFVDGLDLQHVERVAIAAKFSVLFQDFNKYQFTLLDNITIGNNSANCGLLAAYNALKQAGAKEMLNNLPRGLHTQLGCWFENGTELSGGQWQKLALARALARKEACYLVLDEPTTALDSKVEHDILETINGRVKNNTVVIVSHKYSNIKGVDRILYIEDGLIAEEGNHSQLMSRGGRYASLFKLQVASYGI
jgi:ATP-binding cassette subfamily B protein